MKLIDAGRMRRPHAAHTDGIAVVPRRSGRPNSAPEALKARTVGYLATAPGRASGQTNRATDGVS